MKKHFIIIDAIKKDELTEKLEAFCNSTDITIIQIYYSTTVYTSNQEYYSALISYSSNKN